MTAALSERVRWTIADLDGLPDNGSRYEIIDGELFVTRAPHLGHQDSTGLVYAKLLNWSLQSGLGKPFIAPGVIFSESDAVIPDVIWISHQRRDTLIDESGHLTGPPELAVEVLSKTPKDKKRDREVKLKLYSIQGVTEYWILDREQETLEVYRRENGLLKKAATLFSGDRLISPLLPGCNCEVGTLFE